MPADRSNVVRLRPRQATRQTPLDEEVQRVPLVLGCVEGPGGAVSLLIGDEAEGKEVWLTPANVREVCHDLLDLAARAEGRR